MTNVSKPVSESTSRSTGSAGPEETKRGKDGEFDRVLDEKAGPRRRRDEGEGRGDSKSGLGQDRERSEDAQRWRALPGDVAIAYPLRMAPVEAQTVEPVQAIDRVAEVQKVADQILEAAEVRLGPGGTAEAQLELNLGGLGRLSVALERTTEGQIRVAFETANAEAADLLQAGAGELASRLEARGVALQEITVAGANREVFRLEPAEAVRQMEPARLPEPAARGAEAERQQHHRDGDSQRDRGRHPQPEIPGDDDE